MLRDRVHAIRNRTRPPTTTSFDAIEISRQPDRARLRFDTFCCACRSHASTSAQLRDGVTLLVAVVLHVCVRAVVYF